MKKQNNFFLLFIIILAAVIVILAFLNKDSLLSKTENAANAEIMLQIQSENGSVSKEITLTREFVYSLKAEEFSAIIRSNGEKPKDVVYKGVTFTDLLEGVNVDVAYLSQMIVRAQDGYTVALTVDELLQPDNAYLCYMQDGEEMKGMSEGGNGPYQLVLRNDPFSQRWCKYVTEIIFN